MSMYVLLCNCSERVVMFMMLVKNCFFAGFVTMTVCFFLVSFDILVLIFELRALNIYQNIKMQN